MLTPAARRAAPEAMVPPCSAFVLALSALPQAQRRPHAEAAVLRVVRELAGAASEALDAVVAMPALAEVRRLTRIAASIALAGAAGVGSALAQALAPLAPSQRRAYAEAAVLRVARELAGAASEALDAETPLMEAGVDSLAATELSSRLRSLTGVALSPTLVFEQPTPRAVATHLLEQAAHSAAATSMAPTATCFADASAQIALVGMGG
ncbi:MAG: acyl carrier protein, partial [Alphaproteobacteria bacterium]